MAQVAFIGLGIMGASMVINIARGGFAVTGWNRSADSPQAKRAADGGVAVVDSLSQAVANAEFIVLCLSDVQDLQDVLFGETGILPYLQSGSVIMDMSTTGPECARAVHARLLESGVHFLDAPVSGGDIGARNGTLTIMVGGDEPVFERALPLFKTMGTNVKYCGPAGSGQAVKLCNQVLCAVNMVAVCEAFGLAEKLGVDPTLIVDVCSTGAAGSWALSNLGPRILRGDLKPGFAIKHMLKDLRLTDENGGITVDSMPGTEIARRRFVAVASAAEGNGELGTQAMMLAYRAEG